MKKSFMNRIEALESKTHNYQHNEPLTYFDEELGLTMQLIGAGLAVPLPMNEEAWQAMVENQAKQLVR